MDDTEGVVDLNTLAARAGASETPIRDDLPGIPQPEPDAPDYDAGRWVGTLLFRPSVFFTRYGSTEARSGGLILAIWFVAVVSAHGQFESKATIGRAPWMPQTWMSLFIMLAFAGAIGMLVMLGFRGGLYRLRLLLCGVHGKAYWRGMRIWTLASMISAFPMGVLLLIKCAAFDTPEDMYLKGLPGESWWIMGFLILPAWSILASYKGVRAVFPEAGKWRARVWFLGLPLITVAIAIGLVIVGTAMMGFPTPPDLKNRQVFTSGAFRISYPGNWTLDLDPEYHDPESTLRFYTPQGGFIDITIVTTPFDPEPVLLDRVDALNEAGLGLSEHDPISSLGGLEGAGMRSGYTDLGLPWVFEQFYSEVSPAASVQIEVFKRKGSDEHTDVGVAYILDSMRVTAPDTRPVRLDGPYFLNADRWALNMPGEWFIAEQTADSTWIEPWQIGRYRVFAYESQLTITEEIERSLADYFDTLEGVDIERFDTWAGLAGEGRIARGVLFDGSDATLMAQVRIFVHTLPSDELLEMQSVVLIEDLPKVGAGYEMIDQSFSLKPDAPRDIDS